MKFLQKLLGRDDIVFGDKTYMRRWLLPQRWWPRALTKFLPGIRVHNIMTSDEDRALHCHPFDFMTIILKGGYTEYTADGKSRFYGPGSILFRKAETLHRLELPGTDIYTRRHDGILLHEGRYEDPAWTFVIRGPIRRTWGFQTDQGWVPWYEFQGAGESTGEQP